MSTEPFVLSALNSQYLRLLTVKVCTFSCSPRPVLRKQQLNPATNSRATAGPGAQSVPRFVYSTLAAGHTPVYVCSLFPLGKCTFKLALLFQGLCLLA